MKAKFILVGLVVLTLAAVLSAVAISRRQHATVAASGQKVFTVKGVVRSIDAETKTIRIAHEEIPDYMPAMTMPFPVKQPALLAGLTPGDTVKFELTVTDNDSWISKIEKTGGGGAAQPVFADKAGASATVRDVERIQAGEEVPDFELLDQNGKSIHLSDYKGKAVLLTFIYTRCPLPNFCPLMSDHFHDLQQRLTKQFPGKFQLISVSIDPEFDQPAVMKEYGLRHTQDINTWTFATGTREQIDAVANLMGLVHMPENGLISHDLRTAFIGPDGKLVQLWKSNVWTPYEVQRRVAETLGHPLP